MKKIYIVPALLIFSLVGSVSAVESTPTPSSSGEAPKERIDAQKKRAMELREGIKKTTTDFKVDVKQLQDQAAKKRMQMNEKVASKSHTVKDEVRKKKVEKIDDMIAKLNVKYTSHYASIVAKLEATLAKVSERSERLSKAGADTKSVNDAVEKAMASLKKSREAVSAQAAKVYDVPVKSDDSAKADVSKVRKQLTQDVDALKEVVKSSQQAVREAAQALMEVERAHKASQQSTQ